ncbi:hypothetical protein HID58_072137, partial [Brassica napus]
GVGKTTTTANVRLSLDRYGFSVVAIDADLGLCNLDLLLGLENRVEAPDGIRRQSARVARRRPKNEAGRLADFIIIDCPAGIDAGFITAITPANEAMLGLSLLGAIPEDSEVIRSTNRGFPLVLNKPPTLAGLAFEQAAWRLVEQDSMKAVMVEEEPKKHGFFSFFGG